MAEITQPKDLTLGAPTGKEAAERLGITPKYNMAESLGIHVGGPRTLIKSKSGANIVVSSKMEPQWRGFINELESSGYRIDPKTTGGYNPASHLSGGRPSEHARASAVDINWQDNPFKESGENRLPTNIGLTSHKWGLSWGGYFSGAKKDTMHFEGERALPQDEIDRLNKESRFQHERITRRENSFAEKMAESSSMSRRTGALGFPTGPSEIKPTPNIQIANKTEAIRKAGLKSGDSASKIEEHHHHYQTTATTTIEPESARRAIPIRYSELHHATKNNPRTWVDH